MYTKYLGPSWKIPRNIHNIKLTHVQRFTITTYRKHNIVCRELENMDEKSYVPLRDVFHMIENVRDDTHSPKHFLELASMYPEEYLVYINS